MGNEVGIRPEEHGVQMPRRERDSRRDGQGHNNNTAERRTERRPLELAKWSLCDFGKSGFSGAGFGVRTKARLQRAEETWQAAT